MTNYSFPTLGEVLKLLFNATDVLHLNYENKKLIQKQLQRLANEEGNISENLNNLFELFRFNIESLVDDKRVADAIINSIFLVLRNYRHEVRTNGACISRAHIYQWLVGSELLNTIVLAQHKYFLMFNLPASGLIAPEEKHWWLPEIHAGGIECPLGKAFKWMYTSLSINQTHFHYPDHNDLTKSDHRLRQNLENASEWQQGDRIPSLENLLLNLNDSLHAMESTPQEKYRRKLDEKTRASFRIVLFIARISTVISKMIAENLGLKFLQTLVDDFKRQDRRLRKVSRPLCSSVNEIQQTWGISKQCQMDRIWLEHSRTFWDDLEGLFISNIQTIQAWQREYKNSELDFSKLRYLSTHMSSFYAGWYFIQHRIASYKSYAPRFFEIHARGLELKSTGSTTREEIEKYELILKKENLDQNLRWLKNWIWGSYYYRQEKWHKAYLFFQRAFEEAKYSAGSHQYKLVNQFVEICAKNNKWRDFKRGAFWANYLGIEIRWLRGTDCTEDDMKVAYEIMKNTVYPVL